MTFIAALALAAASLTGAASMDDALVRAAIPEDVAGAEIKRYLHPKVPPLVVPESREAWEAQANELRAKFLSEIVLKGVPEAWTQGEVSIRWTEDIETGKGYRIRKLLYEVVPGFWNPALLYEPDGDATGLPTVLNVNGHYAEGKWRPEEQTRCINLAKRGVLNIHPEWIGMGELGGVEYSHERIAYLDAAGVSGVSLFYLSLSRALDVLQAHPRADKNRIGMTGLSGGGWQTALLSALDERVSVVVPVAGHGAMGVRIDNGADIGDIEQVPSNMLTVADYTHLTALFAPRPTLLIYNAQDECCFQAARTLPAILDPVRPVYALYGASSNLDFHINEDPGTHNYDLDNRLQFYKFIDQHLVPEAEWTPEELSVEGELLTDEQLKVGIPADNASVVSLGIAAAKAITRPAIPAAGAARESWKREHAKVLRELIGYVPVNLMTVENDLEVEGKAVATAYRLKSADWTIPAAGFTPAGAEAAEVHLVLNDEGFKGASALCKPLIESGKQAVAVAPFAQNGNLAGGAGSYQYPMIVNATNERALAIQAAQVAAVCEWFRAAKAVTSITLHTTGSESGLIALVVDALNPGLVDAVELTEMPGSLVEFMEARGKYTDSPSLFSFGFLQHFDFDTLRAMGE
jgi:hypothetical protein